MDSMTLAYEHAYISACERFAFNADPPERYMAYVDEKRRLLTTWTGERLGRITIMHTPWRDNFGGERQTIRVQTDHNVYYSGVYYKSAGNYARLRKVKETKLTPVTRIPRFAVITRAIWERGQVQNEAKAELARRGLYLSDEQEAQSRQ